MITIMISKVKHYFFEKEKYVTKIFNIKGMLDLLNNNKKYSFSIKGNNIKEKVCVPVDSMYKKGKKSRK